MTPSLTATPKLHPFTNRILIAVDLRIFAQEAREHFASREHSASAANFTHAFMASIAIPSPSAFLASPVLPTPPSPANAASEAKEKQPAKAKAQIPKAKTDGVTKPKQSKSRNGCVTCKAKRLKCDETKPTCQQCHKRHVECGGYKKDFKWRSLVEATFADKPAMPAKPRKNAQNSKKDVAVSASTSTWPASTLTSPTSPEIDATSLAGSPLLQKKEPVPHPSYYYNHLVDKTSSPNSPLDNESPAFVQYGRTSHYQPDIKVESQPPADASIHKPWLEQHPPPRARPSTSLHRHPSRPEKSVENTFSHINAPNGDSSQEEVEEIQRNDLYAFNEGNMYAGSTALSSTSSEREDAPNFMFNEPKFGAQSPEMLLMNFDQKTCGILSVRNGPNENPWRTIIWPMAKSSPALFHAITSMSAFHRSQSQPELKPWGLVHMNQSIANLRTEVASESIEVALATALTLAFAESWDSHIKSGVTHLRPGRFLVHQSLHMLQHQAVDPSSLARIRFLCNTWLYMDVIARLTSVNFDDGTEIDPRLWSQINGVGTDDEIDPLMGCATTLFPIIGRVANLVRRVRQSRSNSISIVSSANELKEELENWMPPAYLNQPEDPNCNVTHSIQTAEAYRGATLLYLHQAVPEIPSRSSSELAQKVLLCLALVPIESRTIIVHIYPLLAAGCEVSSEEDRDWVRKRWQSMSQKMQIGNVDKCFDVVKEVWRRRDRAEAEQAQSRHGSMQSLSGLMTEMPDIARIRTCGSSNSGSWGPSMVHSSPFIKQEDVGSFHNQAGNLDALEMSNSDRQYPPSSSSEWPVEMKIPLKRTSTMSSAGQTRSRRASAETPERLDHEQTVRGSQHWVGVMQDWEWEVLLG